MNNATIAAAGVIVFAALAVPLAGAQTMSSESQQSVASTRSTSVQSHNESSMTDSEAGNRTDTQTESAMDADLADRVRRSVVSDRNLSSYAAKIGIVSTEGNVRLSGLVQNEGEKAQIASKAAAIAGQRHVLNDLRVMTNVADGNGLRELLQRASEPRATVVAAN